MPESPGSDSPGGSHESAGETSPESPSESPEPSRASPKGSSAASPFIGDPGPAFEPGQAAAEPGPEPESADLHVMPEPPPMWEEDSVRGILNAQGSAVHAVVGVGESDWLYTQADLLAIAPPLTRILNRYPATRAAAGTGDEVAVMLGLGGYVSRSYRERKAVIESLEAEVEEVPITGEPAPPGTGPPEEPPEGVEWKRPSE